MTLDVRLGSSYMPAAFGWHSCVWLPLTPLSVSSLLAGRSTAGWPDTATTRGNTASTASPRPAAHPGGDRAPGPGASGCSRQPAGTAGPAAPATAPLSCAEPEPWEPGQSQPRQGWGRRQICQTQPWLGSPCLFLSPAQVAAAHPEGPSSERTPLLPATRGPHADLKVK